jgi:hypothetical protein
MMVLIGGYGYFCICGLKKEATIQHYADVHPQDAFHHLCKTTLEEWRKATGITEDQEESFVLEKLFPQAEEKVAQRESQRLEDNAAKEQERIERDKKRTDALTKIVSLVQNFPVLCHTSQMQTHRASTPDVF